MAYHPKLLQLKKESLEILPNVLQSFVNPERVKK